MNDGKWFPELNETKPVTEAARTVLEARLGVVRDRLPPALEQTDRDPEHVHQLRVSTRRAGAALNIFASCLPGKTYRKANKKLRRLRRAAGAARDWDVFLIALGERISKTPAAHQPGLDFLLGYGHAQRILAQEHLIGAAKNIDLQELMEKTLADLDDSGANFSGDMDGLGDLAGAMVRGLILDLEQTASQNLNEYEHLHQVRILGKRLRYAMEIFAGCFVPSFREEYYPAVEAMQEILGRANDSYVACRYLEAIRRHLKESQPEEWKRCKPGLHAYLRFHQRRLPAEKQRFLEWWETWKKTGAEAALANLLNKAVGS